MRSLRESVAARAAAIRQCLGCDSGAAALEYALLAFVTVSALGTAVRILALRLEVILWRLAVVFSYAD